MTLTDTSVLVRHYRNPTPHRERLIRTIAPVICGLTVAELLAGARTPVQIAGTQAVLGLFGRLPIAESVWEAAGRNQALLAGNGLIVPLIDTLIATVAIDSGLELWAYDQHFAMMVPLLPGLRLYQEPP